MSLGRRTIQILAFICTLIVGTASMAAIVTQTAWFKEWLRSFIIRQAEDYVNGRLSIGRLDGNLFFGVDLEDIDVTQNGKTVVKIKDAGLNYNVMTFLAGHAVLDSIRLNQPVIHADRGPGGWNIMHLIKARTPDPDEPKRRFPIEIGEIGVSDGTLVFDDKPVGTSGVLEAPSRFDKLDASLGVKSDENELKIDIANMFVRGEAPSFGVNAFSGTIRRRENEVILENVALRTEQTSLRVVGTIRNIEGGTQVVNLNATSDKFTVSEFAQLVPALRGYDLQPAFEMTATGPADRLSVKLNAREKIVGHVIGDVTVDAEAPGRRVSGMVSMEHLNVAPIVRNAQLKSDVTGQARIDLDIPSEGPLRGSYALVASRAQFAGYEARNVHAKGRIDGRTIAVNASGAGYGGQATAKGTIRTGERVAYDLAGRATHVDLRHLPPALRIPGAQSDLQFEYTLHGGGTNVVGELQLAASKLAGADIAPGTSARFSVGGGAPSYSGTGDVMNLDVQAVARGFGLETFSADRFRSRLNGTFNVMGSGGGRYPLMLDATGQLSDSEMFGASFPRLDFTANIANSTPSYSAIGEVMNLDVQTVGRGFELETLSADRFRGRLNGTFNVMGSGGGTYPLMVDATGQLSDSQLFGASFPRLDFTANIAAGNARVRAIGQFNDLDPAVISGDDRLAGHVSGAVDGETTIRGYANGLTIDSFDASGRVNLGKSEVAGFDIDTAVIDGTYGNRAGNINQVSIVGPDVNVQGIGPIALNDSGSSNLTLHAESPSLDRIARTIDQPLKGAAVVDATVTGNAMQLKAQGTVKGSNLGYGENEALSLSSDFSATIPDLKLADATLQAKGTASFLEVAGQKITELSADATYSQSKLDFDATAHEGRRQLTAAGSAIIHADHHEVHIASLALQSEQVKWVSEPGVQAAIQYGGNRMAVENLRLVSGDQHIQADGVIGSPGETLHVRAQNVDVAQLDQLTLGDQRLAGRLTADAMVSGSTSAPRVEGDFALTQGAFQQFKFDSLRGKVQYAGQGVNVDVRLEQTPQAWITATGYAPVSLFTPNPPGIKDVHEAPAPGEAIDLQIASSQIDLGIIQGVTSYVTNVTGVMQANLKVTGSGHDPHLDGVVDIKGGALTIPLLGTAYTGLDTRVSFEPDAVTVSEMRLVDKHMKVLTLGGKLGVHERSVGAVDITAKSKDFEAIDNQYAQNLRVDSEMRLTGSLRNPKIEGYLEVGSGSVDLERVLEEATANPYSIEATPLEPQKAAAPITAPAPSLLDTLDLSLGVAVPSSLVLKGSNLRPANAPIDIGDMTVTVGGAVQVRKAPGENFRLIGEVNTVRGSYSFQGRRFDIMRGGRIRFSGSEELNPQVDLTARRVISGIETFVHVRGTLQEPELTFTSNPPQEEGDILALIMFNLPINELGEGQQISVAEQAGALAGSYLTTGLARSIGNALELDEFEIQALGETGASPSLLIGEQVGKRTFFRVRQGFGSEQATEFILEYQLADYLRFQGAVADISGQQRVSFRRIERGGIDLIFFFSY